MALPAFNFLYIKAGTGTSGTTGDALEVDWRTNFDLIKNLLTSLDIDIQTRIASDEIQKIKVEDGIAYFTTDNGTTWVSLGPSFSNLSGNPDECPALVLKFSNYATNEQLSSIQKRVESVEVSVITIDNTLEILDSDVDTLKQQMNASGTGVLARLAAVELSDSKKISSQSIIEIREVAPGQLEYSTDGETWNPVAEAKGIDWGTIGGDISNQADLMNKFDIIEDSIEQLKTGSEAQIDDIIRDISDINSSIQDLLDHVDNKSNPHEVTKEQVGLGNVDDTSDADKPVSIAQQAEIDRAEADAKAAAQEYANNAANSLKIKVLTAVEYEALETKDASTNYRIIDK